MNDPRQVRAKVLDVLRMAPQRWFTEQMVLDALNMGLLPEPVLVPTLKEAIARQHERDLLESKHDARLEEIVWRITAKGLHE